MAKKYKVRWIVLVVAAAFAFLMCVVFHEMRRESAEMIAFIEKEGESELLLSIYPEDNVGKGYITTPFAGNGENQYYLFVPEWGEQISFSKDIDLDGERVSKEEKISLDAESFLVTCEEKEYWIEVVHLSRIPTLYVNTETGTLNFLKQDRQNEELIEVYAVDTEGKLEEQAAGRVHCRGNTSFDATDKKSYTIELDADTDLYQMGASKKWVLLANAFDSTSIRNYLTFYMAKQMDMYGTPDAQWVDVFANGEYQGIYLLCEKIEIDSERLNFHDLETEMEEKNDLEAVKKSNFYIISSDGQKVIQKGYQLEHEPVDVSGAYLLELEAMPERYEEEKCGFISEEGQQVAIKCPQYASVKEVKYISELYQQMEDALYQKNSPLEDALLEFVDLESFTKKYLIEEVSKNMDASISSLYLYKPEDAVSNKLFAGPVWDYDRAYGNMGKLDDNLDLRTPEDMYVRDSYYGTPFWAYFCLNPNFQESVRRTYEEEMFPIIEECIQKKIPQWSQIIKDSAYADLIRWPNRQEEVVAFQNLSYEEKVEKMIEFLDLRSKYLKKEWGCE